MSYACHLKIKLKSSLRALNVELLNLSDIRKILQGKPLKTEAMSKKMPW